MVPRLHFARTMRLVAYSSVLALAMGCVAADEVNEDKADCAAGCASEDPAISGEFSDPVPIDIFGMHAALLHTGKVLMFAGHGFFSGYELASVTWDPATEQVERQEYATDLFCSHHTFLPDGKLLVAGGGQDKNILFREVASWEFDPIAESWTRVGDMHNARWYPVLLTLPDGRILVASGQQKDMPLEIFDPATAAWTELPGSAKSMPELYPGMRLLPNGQVFTPRIGWDFGTSASLLDLDVEDRATWTDVTAPDVGHEQGGTSFHIDDSVSPPRTVLRAYAGGIVHSNGLSGGKEHAQAEEIDLTDPSAGLAWRALPPMHRARANTTAVMLPDGTVLMVGGQTGGQWNPDVEYVFESEIYHPETNKWTLAASVHDPRQYHSTATLLPDGRVLVAAGEDPHEGSKLLGGKRRDIRTYEIYSPPYLFRGARPEIASAPSEVRYGADFDVSVDSATPIAKVVLISPVAETHHTDTGRFINLLVRKDEQGRLTVRAPSTSTVAPPGFYLLFAVDETGVPSVAKFVQVRP